MKKFIVISIVLLMLAGFAITSSAATLPDPVPLPTTVTLFAGQTLDVGTLTVVFDGTNLVVTYAMNPWNLVEEGWELLETHLYVDDDRPTKSAPGRFLYGPDDVDLATAGQYLRVYTIDLEGFTGTLYIAAQAEIGMVDEFNDPICYEGTELQIEETAWADGTQIRAGKNWATYFAVVVPAL